MPTVFEVLGRSMCCGFPTLFARERLSLALAPKGCSTFTLRIALRHVSANWQRPWRRSGGCIWASPRSSPSHRIWYHCV